MSNNKKNISNARVISEIALGFVFLATGCAIYLLFRSKSLNIYQWCISLRMSNIVDSLRCFVQDLYVTEWIKYSLPDGLYCAAYILIMDAIWHNDNRIIKYFIMSLVPFVTISSELLQYYGLVKGTFDSYDLMCYMIPPTIYVIYIFSVLKFNKLKTQ